MRTLRKSAVISVVFLIGTAIAADAQQQSPASNPQLSVLPPPSTVPPSTVPPNRAQYPASWYYNPYTGGAATCPERGTGGPKCGELIPGSRQ